MKKKKSIWLLAGLLILTACGGQGTDSQQSMASESVADVESTSSEKSVSMKAGTYQASAPAMNGDIAVEVHVTDDAIEAVSVTDHKETYGIGYGMEETPVEVIPARIISQKTPNVDDVTGATITSRAIRNAVADCLTQAGADAKAFPVATTPIETPTKEADVVVLGGGAAGLSAAITAAEKGASVVLLEKQGIVGGSTARSGGKVLAANTPWQEKQGYEDSPEAMTEFLLSYDNGLMDPKKIADFSNDSPNLMNWLSDLGVKIQDVEAIHSSITPWRVHNVEGGGGQTAGHGGQLTVPLYQKAKELGVQFFYNWQASELLKDADGKITGVKAVSYGKEGQEEAEISAHAVILATGGFAKNEEMMKAYADFLPSNKYASVSNANTGDGIKMGEAVGARVTQHPGTQLVYVSFTSGVGINEESGLIVSEKGERVCNEYSYQSHVAQALADAKSTKGYYIATANDPNPSVQYAITLEDTPKAASVEELAKQIGMDPATLQQTVERYNALCATGTDEDFGKPAEYMQPVEGDTYYAILMQPSSSNTFGGLDIDLQARVLDTEGNPISGLYAAGEVAGTGLYGKEYSTCGLAIGAALHFGRIAGEQAATK